MTALLFQKVCEAGHVGCVDLDATLTILVLSAEIVFCLPWSKTNTICMHPR